MRIAFVNLPHPIPVIRRYMCSYNATMFLFPPLELMYAATAAREMAGADVVLIDSIAHRLDKQALLKRLEDFRPDLVVTLFGFEILEDDVKAVRWLRRQLPETKFAGFGHYPTTFPDEILRHADLDFVLRGEPEYPVVELCAALEAGRGCGEIQGLTWRAEDGRPVSAPDRPRVRHVDELPDPDYGLVDVHRYSEFMLPNPFAAVQTARGCPYTCNFCVRSYGQKLTMRSPQRVVAELKNLVERFGIRSFRFTDDTFTAIPKRTLEICEGIRKEGLNLEWTCLTRIDTMDDQRAQALREAGCSRVFIGVESGSDRILQKYGKGYSVDRIPAVVDLLHKHGIEVGSFFMVGHPEETKEDFEETCRLVRTLEIDYATIGRTVPYPGTPLYDEYQDQVEFSLFPYKNEWKDPARKRTLEAWERRFMREMYLRPSYIARHAWRLLKNPASTLKAGKAVLPFLFSSGMPEAARNEVL
jgi:radical SAM superfamily enzyme YgiQ (UPF0313 family)